MSRFELIKLIRQVLPAELAPLEAANGDGMVDVVEGQYASVFVGGSTQATPGFLFPPSLDVQAGDHVQFYRRGGYQLITHVLNRDTADPPVWFPSVLHYGAVGDGLTDDTVAIQSAIDDLPPYIAGVGGGSVYVPPGNYRLTAALNLPTGRGLIGAGMRASVLRGTVAGPLISSSGSFFQSLSDLFVINDSADVASACVKMTGGCANTTLSRCSFMSSGGNTVWFDAQILSDIISCRIGGATGADKGIYLENACNAIRVLNNSVTDSKSGLVAWGSGTALTVIGNEFETIAGGATIDGGIAISGYRAGIIQGNYLEDISASGIVFYSAIDICHSFEISGNYLYNTGAPMIDISNLQHSVIGANELNPGAISPNANGVVGSGANCKNNTVFYNRLVSGTGAAVSITSAVNNGVHYGQGEVALTYSASMTPNTLLGKVFTITVTDGVAFTINSATPQTDGQEIMFVIINSSGGAMGAVTFAGNYRLAGAFTAPANAKRRTIKFVRESGGWTELSRAAADI